MRSTLVPVLANITMTELEKIVVSDLINSGLIKFYIRYVDDTQLTILYNNLKPLMQLEIYH